jgi:hypothetical protein
VEHTFDDWLNAVILVFQSPLAWEGQWNRRSPSETFPLY